MKIELDKLQKTVQDSYKKEVIIDRTLMTKAINLAIDEGYERLHKKQLKKDNILFLIIAITLFSMALFIVQIGFGLVLISLQIIILLSVPILIPLSLRTYLKGGLK